MRKYGIGLLCCVGIVLLSQCRRDKDIFIETGKSETQFTDSTWLDSVALLAYPAVPDVDQLSAVLRTPMRVDSFPAESGTTVVTTDNTIIDIPPFAFQTETGETVRGLLSLEHLVLLNKSSFVANDRSSLVQGRPLNVFGQVFLNVQKGTEKLQVARNKTLLVRFRTANTDPSAQLWESGTPNRNALDWRPAPLFLNGRLRLQTWVNPRDSTRGYAFDTDKLGWNGVGRVLIDSLPALSRFAVALPPRFTNLNTSVFVVYKDEGVSFRLWALPASKQFVLPPLLRGLPLGKGIDIVAVSKVGSDYYFVKREWSVSNNGPDVHVLQPQLMPLAEVRLALSRL